MKQWLDDSRDEGLLILRIGMGLMFVGHGWPKLVGGPDKWASVGQAMGALGIEVMPTLWGFLAAMSEAGGGVLLIVGLWARPAAAMMAATMGVATTMHVRGGDGIMGAAHAIEAATVFLALVLMGPGRFTIARWLRRS